MAKALVVLSGGQDSATCMAWAASRFDEVEAISFDYGQRHIKELDAAKKIADMFGARLVTIKVPVLENNPKSGLTNDQESVTEVSEETNLPKSFVPGRNIIFLTSAASYALSRGIHDIVTGVCQTDYSGYPDCRRATIDAIEKAVDLGCEGLGGIKIHTPLMFLTKAETVKLALETERGMEAVSLSWTCYEGGEKPCGACPACVLRAKGFEEAGIPDPAL